MLFREIIPLLKTVLITATCMCRAPAMLHLSSFMEFDGFSINNACTLRQLVQVAYWKRILQYSMIAFLLRKLAHSGSGGEVIAEHLPDLLIAAKSASYHL